LAFPTRFRADPTPDLPCPRERAATSVKSVAIIQLFTTLIELSERLLDMPPRVTTSRAVPGGPPKSHFGTNGSNNEQLAWAPIPIRQDQVVASC
jgi:hypothetical protein